MKDDDKPRPEELEQARELARALDGESASRAPGELLEAAALLRSLGPAGELDAGRAEEILAGLGDRLPLAAEPTPAPETPRRAPGFSWLPWRWLVPAGALAGLLIMVMLAPGLERSAPPSPSPPALVTVTPPRKLLQAQARALHGERQQEYERLLNDYRRRLLAELARHYRERR